jgi:23S rRNA (guanosine2251-2'-O)-methyltransferase
MTKFRKLSMDELDRISVEKFRELEKNPIIIILDNIRSANNVGSFFRTADAFRVQKIYLCGITAIPPNKEIQKTALGATESVEWEYVENTTNLLERLNLEGVLTIAIEQAENSIMLNKFTEEIKNKSIAVVFGNEVQGVSEEVMEKCTHCIEIPQLGTKHSLNVAVSGGIVLWDILNRLHGRHS